MSGNFFCIPCQNTVDFWLYLMHQLINQSFQQADTNAKPAVQRLTGRSRSIDRFCRFAFPVCYVAFVVGYGLSVIGSTPPAPMTDKRFFDQYVLTNARMYQMNMTKSSLVSM